MWHRPLIKCGLNHKLQQYLPKQFSQILESYIANRCFRVRQENMYSEIKKIKAGVPQGSVLGPVFYPLYTFNIPNMESGTIATFADVTSRLSEG